jgi:hypothetical protein
MTDRSSETTVDADGVLLLEPTTGGPSSPPVGREPSIHMAMVRGGTPSLRSETGAQLHDRLRVTAWALAVLYVVLLLWNVVTRPPFAWIIPLTQGLQFVLALAVALLLGTRQTRRLEQLRRIEGALFGGLVVLLLLAQFLGSLEYIRHADMDETVGNEKNGVLQCILLMTLYGSLIPNDPKRTARVVSLMAVGPLFVLADGRGPAIRACHSPGATTVPGQRQPGSHRRTSGRVERHLSCVGCVHRDLQRVHIAGAP